MAASRWGRTKLAIAIAGLLVGLASPAGAVSTELRPAEQAAAAAVTPAVVDINATIAGVPGAAAGTGIVLRSDGLVLTSRHVVSGATALDVRSATTGGQYQAVVLGYDIAEDIAVLQLSGATALPPAVIGDSSRLRVGDRVVAVGNAGGRGGTPTSVAGRVTGRGRTVVVSDPAVGDTLRLRNMIAVSAPVQSGQSGGPMVTLDGAVIGVTAAASVGSSGESTTGWAVSINRAMTIVSDVLAGRQRNGVHIGPPGFLGVRLTDSTRAAVIAEVLPGTPAATAGLAPGDRITRVGSHRIGSRQQLARRISARSPGSQVNLRWTSPDGARNRAKVVLGQGPLA